MSKKTKADFCIEVNFEKGSENPSRIFKSLTELIDTFQQLDKALVESIDSKIEPVATIEDIESGSIRVWFAQKLKSVDDDGLKKLNWKEIVGKYLVDAKYIVINWLEGTTEITDKIQIEVLEQKLLSAAIETDVTHFPSYSPIQRQKLLPAISRISAAADSLKDSESVNFVTGTQSKTINAKFKLVPESIEDLLTQETLTSTSEMILKVKKPDYLGESMWEFRHGTRPFEAKILDTAWLKEFQNRKYDVRPGDSLRTIVKTEVQYGYDNEVVAVHNLIEKVKEVIPLNSTKQLNLTE